MYVKFKDRIEAGRLLAEKLGAYAGRPDVTVLALPRGGVPVAFEVARSIGAPLDVLTVRKLGVPGYEELAMGAIAPVGVRVLNTNLVWGLGLTEADVDRVAERELRELERRERAYRGERPALDVSGRTVILVDDGLATGATMRAAVRALREMRPAEIVVAAPVASRETCDDFREEFGTPCVCALTPFRFNGVGQWYEDFAQTTDEEVRDLLARAALPRAQRAA